MRRNDFGCYRNVNRQMSPPSISSEKQITFYKGKRHNRMHPGHLAFLFLFLFLFSFISLIADGPHHYHPACGHKGSSHLSPVHALQFFYRDASSALLQLVNQWLNFYLLTFPRFPLRKKEHKSYFGRNRTHDFCTSRCAAYLLDHSGDTTG